MDTGIVIQAPEPLLNSQAIVYPDYFKAKNLRAKVPTVLSRNLPVISQSIGDSSHTSTLFCHKGFEIYENEEEVKKRFLNKLS